MSADYGIVANVTETDSAFRRGAKAWMSWWYSGGERAKWIALTRGGRTDTKEAPIYRFNNFRCAWIPEHLDKYIFTPRGSRLEMEHLAARWAERADEARSDHPNRLFQGTT